MRRGRLDPASLQRMLYDALDASDDLVLVLERIDENNDGPIIVSANDAFCRTTGFGPADILGRPLLALAAPDADAAVSAALLTAVAQRRSFRSELLCARANGTPFWFGMHVMPVDPAGPSNFVVLGRDITESRHAHQQQAAVQSLLAKVFLCVQAAVAIVSDTGTMLMTNPALDLILGQPAGGLVGKRAADLIAPSVRPALLAARQRQVENGEDYTIATLLIRADGTEVPVEVTSVTVQRDDLKHFRIVTVVRRDPDPAAPPVTVHVAGKIRLIGLEDVRTALGPRWAAVAARAMASAEHVIRRHCGPGDNYSRTDDGGFLICFGNATENEAAFRAASIAREVRARLIGEGETQSNAVVSAITAAVDIPHEPGRSPDMLAALIGERLNGRLAQIEAQARETLRDAVHSATCELEAVRTRRTDEVVAWFARLPVALERRLQAAYCALPAADREQFDFDRLVLGVAAEQAIEELATGGSMLILLNVDFEVFLDRRRLERYLAACQALDARLRQRLILILSGMPKGFPKSRVLDCVTRLRPFCQGVGFQSDTLEAPAVEFSVLGASIVVLREDALQIEDAKAMARLGKLIDGLHAHQARVLVRHISSRAHARQLGRLGVDLIGLADDDANSERARGHG